MVAIIVILSLLVPLADVLIFAGIYEHAGIWAILGPSIVTMIAGLAILIRSIPHFMKESVDHDKYSTFPTMQSFFDASRMVSGVMLFIPGFISDLIGLVLLLPTFRGISFMVLAHLTSSRKERIVPVNPRKPDGSDD